MPPPPNDSLRWDNELMLDRYIYDYLKKQGMHRCAEVFKAEANVTVDPAFPSAIDVDGGFLYEWWSVFYEMFKARQERNSEKNQGSQMKVEDKFGKAMDMSASGHSNNQPLECFVFGSNDGRRIKDDMLPFTQWPFTGENSATSLPPIPQQKERVTGEPELRCSQGDLWDIVASSGYLTNKKRRTGPEECNFASGSGMGGVDEALSDASELWGTSMAADSEVSSHDENGNGSASSKLQQSAESLKGNASKGANLGSCEAFKASRAYSLIIVMRRSMSNTIRSLPEDTVTAYIPWLVGTMWRPGAL